MAKTLGITLPDKIYERLREYCDDDGLSKSGVIALALKSYLPTSRGTYFIGDEYLQEFNELLKNAKGEKA